MFSLNPDWTLKRLFGSKVLRSACPLASRSRLLLSDYCPALGVRIMAQPSSSVRDGDWLVYYIAKETGMMIYLWLMLLALL